MFGPLNRVINALVQVGGWSLMAAACLVTYDIITRKVFNYSIAGADEISGYVFAVATACAYSYALVTRANIRIDLLYNVLPAPVQRVLDILSMAAMFGFFGVVCYFSYNIVSDAFLYDSRSITPLQTPLVYPQTLWYVGLCFAALTSFLLLITAVFYMLKGKQNQVDQLMGIPSLDEEIATELGEEADKLRSHTNSDVKGD
ncbi:TRAP transporter small permease subunit [Sneathiella sp. P13V-1]|uniref:TRAP transporter small permease subunit n=1 Tax=Sneathiella sp. P13V-1 TaxID=2697366 RepID=UPI00187B5E05|nr:TRAP transporter small permease [Sneathiella sp. P13V-1]MBE7637202.1 TRAP transporter small permease subunit [Sneathiella sp. P13V-1]